MTDKELYAYLKTNDPFQVTERPYNESLDYFLWVEQVKQWIEELIK